MQWCIFAVGACSCDTRPLCGSTTGLKWVVQVHLVVATPKRLAHLVKAKQIDLSSVQFLILDEADKLFELGFVSHIDAIIHACSNPGIVSLILPFRT